MRKTNWKPIDSKAMSGKKVLVYIPDFDSVEIAWFCEETGLWPSDSVYNEDGEPCNVGLPSLYMGIMKPY